MKQVRRKSRWRSQNSRRRRRLTTITGRAWAAESRRLARADREAEREASLLAEVDFLGHAPSQPRAPSRPLRVRLSVEVLAPDGTRDRHRMTLAWCPLFRRWSVPTSQIVAGISALLSRAPEIANLRR